MPTKRKPAKDLKASVTMNNLPASGGGGGNEGPFATPLLEGLLRRPGVADSVMKDVFDRWKSSQLMVRSLESLWEKRKNHRMDIQNNLDGPPPSKRRRGDKKRKDQHRQSRRHQHFPEDKEVIRSFPISNQNIVFVSSSNHSFGGGLHWLIKSLASRSVRERRVAFQIVAAGSPMDDASVCTLIEITVHLIRKGNPSLDSDAMCMVGWIALLKLVAVQILSDAERLAFCARSDIGLSCLCSTLWTITSQHKINACTTRICMSLVDLVHSLVLTGRTKDKTYQVHKKK